MSPARDRGRAPSWLGTLVVAVAVVVMALRAAATLRGSVAPGAPGSPSASAPAAASAPP